VGTEEPDVPLRKDGTPRAVGDRHYYSMFEYAGVGVANVNFTGELMDVNARFCEMLGYSRDELLKCTFQQLTHPDDLDANLGLLTKVRQGEIDGYRIEKRYRRANNEILWAELTVSIEKDNDGHQCGLISIIQDISQRRQNEERLNFLMGEVAHRSKNMLAIVRAMARQIAHNTTSVQDFQKALDLRIAGMGASYNLTFQSADNHASLDRLIGSQLALFVDRRDGHVRCEGPRLVLGPNAARVLGMGLHELATNSCKYGALSAITGTVHIGWQINPAPQNSVTLHWIERGGPPVIPPAHIGFGRKVTETMVAVSLQGDVKAAFLPGGLEWDITIPLGSLQG